MVVILINDGHFLFAYAYTRVLYNRELVVNNELLKRLWGNGVYLYTLGIR